mmetsp:Transcript_20969/g.49774  ORF Transcript_20969/g.49774 Transcript_20969/m.49774 type:complete len:98 (-) Transcript_20969:679-972(-)
MSSVCVPCSTTRPSLSTAILSARFTVLSLCAITSVVRPSSKPESRASSTTRSDCASSAEVASSRIRIAGCLSRARAIATRCFCPPERPPPPALSCLP